MEDVFVQRMIARTQARRNVLQKLAGESDKENSSRNFDNKSSTLNSTNVSTCAVAKKIYKSTDLDQSASPEKKVESEQNFEVLQESSVVNKKTVTSHHTSLSSTLSPHKALDSTTHISSFSTQNRFQLLAQRTKEIGNWEDDYTYHSTKEVAGSSSVSLGLHDVTNASAQVKKHDLTQNENRPSDTNSCFEETETNTPTKYYFGDFQTPSKKDAKNQFSHVLQHCITPQSPADASFYSATSNFSSHTPLSSPSHKNMLYSSPLTSTSKQTPPTTPKPVLPPNSVTPTRRLAWDRQLLKSLEEQGFTPSTSRSRLAYDFRERDRSPLKEPSKEQSPRKDPSSAQLPKTRVSRDGSPIKDPPRGRPLTKSTPADRSSGQNVPNKSEDGQGPKIVSFQSKCNLNIKHGAVQNVSSQVPKESERDESPSKVSNLRSHWEQHIRDTSPDKELILNRSPSPVRKMAPKAFSTTNAQAPPLPQVLTRGLPSRKSVRSLNSQQSGPCAEVIKGEAPMPPMSPVVKNPAASVKERAAAFSSILPQRMPEKDPTELSVRDRKNLFEKKKGAALQPKAPFGQCVSDKVLQSTTSAASPFYASKSYEAPKSSKPVPSSNKTYICPSRNNPPANRHNEERFSVQSNRERFEHVEDNWRATDINAKIRSERQEEMHVLHNRFKRPGGKTQSAAAQNYESEDTEYPGSDDDSDHDSAVFPPSSSEALVLSGPPKPPRVAASEDSPPDHFIPPPPPPPQSPLKSASRHSPSKRLNSTELDESSCRSPSRDYVPKVKPGCLFPSLSDIESHSEAHESDDETKDSSFAESVLTCSSMDSLGTRIQKWAQSTSVGPLPVARQLSTINEKAEAKKAPLEQSMSASTLEALEAIDDALDEAFDYEEEPTPPKRARHRADAEGRASAYKTPKIRQESTSSSDSENPLAHSISMYRKQRPADVAVTPIRQVMSRADFTSPKDSPISPSVTISSRIRELQEEEERQLKVISQASSAVSVVAAHPEQHGTTQHIEAEKFLLVSAQKRQAALHEIQRLKAEGALGKRSYWSQDEDSSRGSISIGNITLPLKSDFLEKSLKEKRTHHFLVLVKHREQVITSQLLTTPDCIVEGAVTFPNLMALHDLSADFNISLEVYDFKVEPLNHGIKKEHSRLKLTPLKRLHKESKLCPSPAVSSPGGPYSIRTSSFLLIGFANLNINTLTRNAWTLEKVPFTSPMNGHLLMRVSVAMEGGVSERSFLTMFDDVGGFGAWNRRWCALNGPFIRYWSYPDDENRKDCLGKLDLRSCTTRKVELVSRDVCARRFTFQLTLVRPLAKGDATDLVHEVKDNTLITRILLSADSNEERILWCNKLNKALANIRAWDPDALRPEDFHV